MNANNAYSLILLLLISVLYLFKYLTETSKIERIFAYGTLNNPTIQLKLYNRKLYGTPDQLNQYYLSTITQNENNKLNTYPIAIYSGKPSDVISGMVYEISQQELKETDIYEGIEYKRTRVQLQSGLAAWVYILQ
ncbi:MAG: gamma-glutamylcyclotransferase family protein [Taibaiella sp.]|jgi:gamma-glutamylcyclotransferase (GGCT)/AIG2-like uncharacterized protein YtfP